MDVPSREQHVTKIQGRRPLVKHQREASLRHSIWCLVKIITGKGDELEDDVWEER